MISINVTFWQGTEKSSSSYTAKTYEDALQQANNGIFDLYYAQPPKDILDGMAEDMKAGRVNREWSWFIVAPTIPTHPAITNKG